MAGEFEKKNNYIIKDCCLFVKSIEIQKDFVLASATNKQPIQNKVPNFLHILSFQGDPTAALLEMLDPEQVIITILITLKKDIFFF
jgi:hypothetical protein